MKDRCTKVFLEIDREKRLKLSKEVIADHSLMYIGCTQPLVILLLYMDFLYNLSLSQKVKKALIKVFWSLVSLDEAENVLEVVLYPKDLEVNCHLFSCICCVARRVLYLHDK